LEKNGRDGRKSARKQHNQEGRGQKTTHELNLKEDLKKPYRFAVLAGNVMKRKDDEK